jgi:hypothetical protein
LKTPNLPINPAKGGKPAVEKKANDKDRAKGRLEKVKEGK